MRGILLSYQGGTPVRWRQKTHHVADEWLPASGRLEGVGWYDCVLRIFSLDAVYEFVLKQLVCLPGDRVLDMGCGTGSLASSLRRSHPKVRVTGLDRDPRMLVRAADRQRSGGVSWVEGSGQRLPFASEAFDAVTATLFLHHLTHAQKMEALGEANRVLRPGGSLHIADWIKPKPGISAVGFALVRLLDGYERTADHASGRLTDLIQGRFLSCQILASAAHLAGDVGLLSGYQGGGVTCGRLRVR